MKPVTLTDIASETGLSKITVSRALRNQESVKPATRQRVLAAAQKLGYRPNPMVQTLMSSVRRRIPQHATLLAWVSTTPKGQAIKPGLHIIRESAEARARDTGFSLVEFSLVDDPLPPERIASIFQARNIRGAIIAPLFKETKTIDFPWDSLAVATIGDSLREPHIHHTLADYHLQTQRVIGELRRRGYKRIAYCPHKSISARNREHPNMVFHYFLESLPQNRRIPIAWLDDTSDGELRDWHQQYRPDAIIFDLPNQADRFKQLGFRIPDDFGVAILSVPPDQSDYSGIRLPIKEMGAGAVDLVAAQLIRNEVGVPDSPKSVLIEGKWVEGKTLRPRIDFTETES